MTFEPRKPEKRVVMEITVKEKQLLLYMREMVYGEFTVHKANNVIVRVNKNQSLLLTDEDVANTTE